MVVMVVLLFVGGAEAEEREGFSERRRRRRSWWRRWTAEVSGLREEEEGRGRSNRRKRMRRGVSGGIRVMVKRIRLEPVCEEIGIRISHGEERERGRERNSFKTCGIIFIQET